MKVIQSSFFRALCAIFVGFLLIKYREDMVSGMIIAIGVLFFISGIISCAVYYSQLSAFKKSASISAEDTDEGRIAVPSRPIFPIVGLGSAILGLVLATMPGVFIEWLSYILLAILLLGTIAELVNLATAYRYGKVHPAFWVMPVIMLLASIAFIVHPEFIATAPFFFVGWAMIIYGVVEIINSVKIYSVKKTYLKMEQNEELTMPIKPKEEAND